MWEHFKVIVYVITNVILVTEFDIFINNYWMKVL